MEDPGRVAKVRGVALLLEKDVGGMAKHRYGIALPAENHDEYPIDETYFRELVRFCRQGGFTID